MIIVDRTCPHCFWLLNASNRRFYLDMESVPYVIIDDDRRLCPMLLTKKHELLEEYPDWNMYALRDMNRICRQLFGDDYWLTTDTSDGHLVIRSNRFPLTTTQSL